MADDQHFRQTAEVFLEIMEREHPGFGKAVQVLNKPLAVRIMAMALQETVNATLDELKKLKEEA